MVTIEKLNEIHLIAMAAVGEARDMGCCGFAWVNVRDIRRNAKNADRSVLQGFGFKFSEYDKCFQLWVSHFGQSIDNKEKYAYAFSNELKKLGLNAGAGSRMD